MSDLIDNIIVLVILIKQYKLKLILQFSINKITIRTMLADKKNTTNNSSNYRISLAKPLIHSKNTSNRSISIAHTGNSKKEISPVSTTINGNSSIIGLKNLSIERIYSSNEKQYYFYLGRGNNQDLVRRVLKTRAVWIQKDDSTNAFINFKWQQDQKGYRYNRLIDSGLYRCVLDQLEFHECLTNKEHLFKNLQSYCLKHNVNLWQIVPPTFVLNSKDQVNMQHLDRFFDYYQKHLPKHIKNAHPDLQKQIFNYRKKLKAYFFNCNLKKILPKLPKLNQHFIDSQGQYLWIIKPTFLNRGRGIKVLSKLQALYKYIQQNVIGYLQQPIVKQKSQQENSPKNKIDYIKRNSQFIKQNILSRDPNNRQIKQRKQAQYFDGNQYIRLQPRCPAIIKTDKFLIQKYLQKPLLIMNRKFDIRIWVLISHNLKCYVFKQGYIRLSSMQYCVKDDQDNTFRHLTNNAVQKFSSGYGQLAQGNQLPYSKLKQVMQAQNMSYDKTLQTIHNHIKVSIQSVWKFLNPSNRKFQFQVFGYDFMIDKSGHPWLIEVNNNPCIQQSSTILKNYLPRMLNDAFKLTLDQLFWGSVSNGKFPVQGYEDNQNMWLKLDIQQK